MTCTLERLVCVFLLHDAIFDWCFSQCGVTYRPKKYGMLIIGVVRRYEIGPLEVKPWVSHWMSSQPVGFSILWFEVQISTKAELSGVCILSRFLTQKHAFGQLKTKCQNCQLVNGPLCPLRMTGKKYGGGSRLSPKITTHCTFFPSNSELSFFFFLN